MGGDDGTYPLRRPVLPGKLQGFRIHTVDRGGGRQMLAGEGVECRHVDLRRVKEADLTGSIGAMMGHGARL